jgi:molecular chaperone IbpA
VKDARLENGLLHINLVREVPEEKKPRKIAIVGGNPNALEGEAA